MSILQSRDQQIVSQRLESELKREVALTLYTQQNVGGLFIPGRECQSCLPTQQLLEEVVALSPMLNLDVVDYYSNQASANEIGIDKIPAIVIHTNMGDNARFYGLPSGIEFAVLLETIIAASQKRTSLEMETRRTLKHLKEDIHIQVFVTPT